jgi:phage protein D
MSIAGFDPTAPSVTFELVSAPPNITSKDLEQRLMHFEYVDEPRKKPIMTFQFDNTDGKIVNMAVLFVGLQMKITFGYEGLRSRPFRVTITKIKAAPVRSPSTISPAPGAWGIIHMEGLPQTPKLHWRPELDVGTFRNMKLADIVRQIARQQGFRETKIFVQDGIALSGQPDAVYEEVSINEHETCHEFLTRIADELGFQFRTIRDEFHFHQDNWKGFGSETIEYFYGPDLLDFTIEGDYDMNVRKVRAKAIDPYKRAMSSVDVEPGKGGVIMPTHMEKHDVMTALPAKLRQAAARRLINRSSNRWFVRASLVGNPKVLRGMALDLKNFGPFLDGHWVVRSVRHTIDNVGYTTDVGLKHVIPGKAAPIKYFNFVYWNPETKEFQTGTIAIVNQTSKEMGKKKKGRLKREGPGHGGKSLTKANQQTPAAQLSKRANYSGRREPR